MRLVFPNTDLALKPNMFADVVISGAPGKEALKIPREALIVTGERDGFVHVLRLHDVTDAIERRGDLRGGSTD